MSPELMGILSLGVALASITIAGSGILITGQRSLRQEFRQDISELRQSHEDLRGEVRQDSVDLRERMARLEGLFRRIRPTRKENRLVKLPGAEVSPLAPPLSFEAFQEGVPLKNEVRSFPSDTIRSIPLYALLKAQRGCHHF